MLAYATTSTPIRPKHTAVARLFVTQPRIPAQQSANYLRGHLAICYHHRLALRGTSSVMVRLCCGAERASFVISSPSSYLVPIGFYLLFSKLIPIYFPAS